MSANAPAATAGTTAGAASAPATSDRPAGIEAVSHWLSHEWHWLVIGLIYVLGWYTPFTDEGMVGDGPVRWCWDGWGSLRFVCGWQLYVPLAVAVILYARRAEIRHFYQNRVLRFAPGHPKRIGNLYPLIFGCFLLIIGDLVQVKGVGVIAMVVITYAIVYRMYGPLMLRGPLFTPMLLLLTMIPPPDHVTDVLLRVDADRMLVKLSAILLSVAGLHASAAGEMLTMTLRGYTIDISHEYCSGANVILTAWLALITYHMARRSDPTITLLSLVISALIGSVLQVGRNMFIAIDYASNPEFADWMIYALLPTCLLMVITFFATILVMRISILDKIRMPQFLMRSVRVAGRGLDHAAEKPLDGIEKGFSAFGKLWKRSERGIENIFRALTPKKKRRSRRRW